MIEKIENMSETQKNLIGKAMFSLTIIFLFLGLPEISLLFILLTAYGAYKIYGKYGLIAVIYAGSLLFVVNHIVIMLANNVYRLSEITSLATIISWLVVIIGFIYMKFMPSNGSILDKEGMFSLNDISSFPKENEQEEGYKFSTIKELKKFDNGIKIDNFNYYPIVEKYVLNKKHLAESKKTSIRIKPLNFTKTFLVLGSMGSGKTEFFHSILNQHQFNRNIIHDIKGDFVEKWYNPKIDFIFNPYDERGVNWDLWNELKESPALVESFIGNLMESQTEEKDFFTASAKKVIIDFFMKIHYQHSDKSSTEKWILLNKEIEIYKEDSESNKTKSSIYQTMDLVIELFSYMAWHSEQGKQSFTINKFLNENSGTLFLLNNSSVATKLTPLFTGFLSLFTEILLSKSDTKENLTLILLDEYLSMSFEKQTRLKLLTQIRSKGGCLMLGMQYLPKHDMEHQQLLDSSSYAKLIFQISDNETINHIIDNISDVTYVSLSKGTSNSSVTIMDSMVSKESGSKGTNTNRAENTKKLLSSSHLQSMPAYSHLSIIASEKILYLGYTEMVKNLIAKNNHFEPIDQNDYYRTKYTDSVTITSQNEDRLKDINDEIAQLERELQK